MSTCSVHGYAACIRVFPRPLPVPFSRWDNPRLVGIRGEIFKDDRSFILDPLGARRLQLLCIVSILGRNHVGDGGAAGKLPGVCRVVELQEAVGISKHELLAGSNARLEAAFTVLTHLLHLRMCGAKGTSTNQQCSAARKTVALGTVC